MQVLGRKTGRTCKKSNAVHVSVLRKLFTLRFKVSDAAAIGTYSVNLSYSVGDTANAAERPVALNI